MPDNKTVGWRQKIHGKPKDAPLPKLTIDDATSADDLRDRRRHGWRKTLHTGSRPVTPISTTPTTPTVQDVEDHHSETSETTTPRRNSKPKLIRYTSLFSSYKDSARRSDSFNAPDFVEPWSDNTPFSFQPYVDPLVAIQSIRAHMTSSLNPIPLQHNNNLFCVFEDYRRLRHQHEHLEASLLERSKEFEEMTEHWVTEEQKYQAEIRRLELLIARGESGVAGVIKARHGSIVDRKRRHHKTTSIAHSHLPDAPTSKELKIDMMTEGQNSTSHRVYPQIKLTQTVDTFRRPLSPSDRMVDLSKRLSSKPHEDVSIGTPPSERTGTTLARKVQSELNISELMGDEIVDTSSASVNSDFSTGDAGDLLPDEMLTVPCVDPLSSTERELLIALQELAVLIARRRDIDVEMFVEDIMALMQAPRKKVTKTSQSPRNLPAVNTSVGTESKNLDDTPRATLRNFQPHPQIKFPLQRRHFSFEPGEDDLRALREGMSATKPAVSVTEFPAEHRPYSLRDRYRPVSPTAVPSLPKQMPVLEFGKHSKIPSPVQPLGRVRSIHRESSISSMHSTLTSPTDERRESRSSTFTALRNDSSGDLQSGSTSGKTSPYTSSLRSQRGHTHVRNSVAVIAAARAVELMDRTILDQEGSPRTSGATAMVGSPSRLARDLGTSGPENDRP